MSNILIIKHGALGDIVQISGVLEDIKANNKENKIFLLTTSPYIELLNRCPFIDEVLLDKRLPRWNIFYLLKLKSTLNKFKFTYVYDLQNSSRTQFYKRYLLNIDNWSSSQEAIKKKIKKKDFDKNSVLDRFKFQLEQANIKTSKTLTPDFNWACINIDEIVNKYLNKKFILIFPFCSPQLKHKKWPYYNELIKIIKSNYSKFEIIIAPDHKEINEAKKINAICIKNNQQALNIAQLASLIKKSTFVLANDTGPAHMAAHLGVDGLALFGYHTSSKKVSIETKNFKAISINNLKDLSPETVFSEVKKKLDLIN